MALAIWELKTPLNQITSEQVFSAFHLSEADYMALMSTLDENIRYELHLVVSIIEFLQTRAHGIFIISPTHTAIIKYCPRELCSACSSPLWPHQPHDERTCELLKQHTLNLHSMYVERLDFECQVHEV